MESNLILGAVSALGGAGLFLGLGLAYASKKFHVDIDERVEVILDKLPGTNCGACGYIGCEDAAGAIAMGTAPVTTCTAGGQDTAHHVADIMGVEAGDVGTPKIATLRCGSGRGEVKARYDFDLFSDCSEANMVAGGPIECGYGCLGYATCVKSCPFDAMYMGEDNLPKIIIEKCTGCGICDQQCPRNLLPLIDIDSPLVVACSSKDKGKDVRGYCKKGCIACKICEKTGGDGGFIVIDNLAEISYEKYNSANDEECIEKCPTNCILLNEGIKFAKQNRTVKKAEQKKSHH